MYVRVNASLKADEFAALEALRIRYRGNRSAAIGAAVVHFARATNALPAEKQKGGKACRSQKA